jgi:hypothetical protein
LLKEEQIDSDRGGSGGDGAGLYGGGAFRLRGYDEVEERKEQRAVANSSAQFEARDAVDASGWDAETADMRREMQLAMEKATLEVRRRWRQDAMPVVKQEPTEQQPAVPIVKEEQPEQHGGGGGDRYGGLRDLPRLRVQRGGVAAAITTNQMQAVHDAVDLTGEGDLADSLEKQLDNDGVAPLDTWQVHATDV